MIKQEYTQVVLQYPPDYDGEQHIECFTANKGTRLNVSFETAVLSDETKAEEVLYRIAQDIIKKLGKYR